MEISLGEIKSSPLLPVQKISVVKTFILSSIDLLLLNAEVGRSRFQVINKKIRGMINRELKIESLPIKCQHASRNYGGLSSPSLQDRGDVLTIRSFAQMTLSHNECVLAVMRQFIEDEGEFKRIETDANARFLD
jgi:hypothetical protein